MKAGLPKYRCIKCNQVLSDRVAEYSIKNYNLLLCYNDQQKLKIPYSKSTPTARKLFAKLIQARIPAFLEKFDGYKTIDVAVPRAKLNIEVDGKQHYFNNSQALSDLNRYLYSSIKGYETIRIPNILVEAELDIVAQKLIEFIKSRMANTGRNSYYHEHANGSHQKYEYDEYDEWDDDDTWDEGDNYYEDDDYYY